MAGSLGDTASKRRVPWLALHTIPVRPEVRSGLLYIARSASLSRFVCVHLVVCVNVCMCVCMYVCACVCVYIYIYIYIYILCIYGRLVCILLHNAARSFETTGSAGGVLPSPVAGAGGGWGGEPPSTRQSFLKSHMYIYLYVHICLELGHIYCQTLTGASHCFCRPLLYRSLSIPLHLSQP
jgi:hypothetical protein